MKIIKPIMVFLAIIKSFFIAVTQVVWGVLSLFGLNALIAYFYIQQGNVLPESINESFMFLQGIIMDNIMWFILVFFILSYYSEVKEILR